MTPEKRRYLSNSEKLRLCERQRWKCACGCKRALEVGRIDYDHILPLWLGGTNSLDNFHALIKRHHADKTSREAKERAKSNRIIAKAKAGKKLSQFEKHMRKAQDFAKQRSL